MLLAASLGTAAPYRRNGQGALQRPEARVMAPSSRLLRHSRTCSRDGRHRSPGLGQRSCNICPSFGTRHRTRCDANTPGCGSRVLEGLSALCSPCSRGAVVAHPLLLRVEPRARPVAQAPSGCWVSPHEVLWQRGRNCSSQQERTCPRELGDPAGVRQCPARLQAAQELRKPGFVTVSPWPGCAGC